MAWSGAPSARTLRNGNDFARAPELLVRSRLNASRSARFRLTQSRSDQDVFDHIPSHIRQAVIPSAMAKGELRVIEAEAMQDSRVELVDVALVLNDLHAEVVGPAVGDAAFD